MNQKVLIIGFTLLIVMLFSNCTQQSDFPVITGPYLGQKPPGDIPEIFAPGVISTGMSESAIAVSPDGNEIFYTVHAGNSETIVTTRLENGVWTAPEVATFSGKYLDGFPAMHPDGSRLYFHSYRPLYSGEEIAEVVNIWFVEREGNGWGEPKPISPPVNGDGFVCCPSITRTGTLYYSKKLKTAVKKYTVRDMLTDSTWSLKNSLPM